MNIIIVGNGKVGITLAKHLVLENHNIIIIDNDEEALQKADASLDVMCIVGNGARPSILQAAGIETADVLIAVTPKDEINMICCLAAKKLSNVKTIARIRDPEYFEEFFLLRENMGIDMFINPEYCAAVEISNLLQFPSAMNIEYFLGGKVRMVEFKVHKDDFLDGAILSKISSKLPSNILLAAVDRDNVSYIPDGKFQFLCEDKVYVIGQFSGIIELFKKLGRYTNSAKSVLIAGGGRTSYYLAKMTAKLGIYTKIIELNHKKCKHLSETLTNIDIVEGDATDLDILESENIDGIDAFITLTGRDEENLITAMYAAEKGVSKVIAMNSRLNLPSIVNKLGIESVINQKHLTAGSILTYIRSIKNSRGSVLESINKIIDDKTEVLAFTANKSTSFLNIPLKKLTFKNDTLIVCILHKNSIIIPHGDEVIHMNDKIILVTKDIGVVNDLNDILA